MSGPSVPDQAYRQVVAAAEPGAVELAGRIGDGLVSTALKKEKELVQGFLDAGGERPPWLRATDGVPGSTCTCIRSGRSGRVLDYETEVLPEANLLPVATEARDFVWPGALTRPGSRLLAAAQRRRSGRVPRHPLQL